jgi:hypothetical protein
MKKLSWLACALQFFQPLGLPVLEFLHGIAADAELDEMERHFLAASTAVIMQPCYPARLVYPTTPAQFPRQKSRQTDASVIRSDESTHRFPAIAQQAALAAASATKLKAHARGEEE